MRSSFSALEEYTISFTFVLVAIAMVLMKILGIFPSYFDDIFITVLLAMILLDSLTNRIRLEKRIEKLGDQIAEGNPNAVFKLSDLNLSLANIAKNAQSDLLLVGTSFVGFLSAESHIIIQSLERGLKVRVVLLDPTSNVFSQNDPHSANIKKDIEYSLSQLEKIGQLTNKLRGTLEVRVSQSALSVSGLQADANRINGVLLISLLSPTTTSESNTLYFVINKKVSNELFENFSQPLELAWENSKSIYTDISTQKDI